MISAGKSGLILGLIPGEALDRPGLGLGIGLTFGLAVNRLKKGKNR